MDIKLIESYIKSQSSPNSVSNAYNVYPELIENLEGIYKYSCAGSMDYVYEIKIVLADNKVFTSCDCPYKKNYVGICKHVIASLRKLVTDYKKGDLLLIQKDLFGTIAMGVTSKLLPYQIVLNNGILTSELIQKYKINANRYNYYNECKIVSVSQTIVNTKISGWQSEEQNFQYSPETFILEFNCSCTKTRKLCEHIGMSLEQILKIFGANLFSKTYLHDKIKMEIEKHGFSIEDDYNSVFSFELSPKGFVTTSKFKNIIKEEIDYTKIFENEEDYDFLKLPIGTNTSTPDYGLGNFFSIRKNNFTAISPFQGKYNKAKTDFSSSITEINFNNLDSSLTVFETEKEQQNILKTLQINQNMTLFIKEKDIHYIKKSIALLNEILPLLETTFLYKYEAKNSLIRKNLTPVVIAKLPVKLVFQISETAYFYTLKAKLEIEGKRYNFNSTKLIISSLFIFINDNVIPIIDTKLAVYLNRFVGNSEINYLKKETPNFIEKVLIPLAQKFEIESTILKKSKVKESQEDLERHVYMSDANGEYITFKLAIKYPEKLVNIQTPELLLEVNIGDGKLKYRERNQSLEDNFIEEFKSFHPKFQEQEEVYYLTPEELFENYWMLHSVDRMKQLGIQVFGANELKSFKFNLNKAVISVNLKSDIDWFDIEIDISFGNQKVNLKELHKSFLKKSNYVSLGDGTLGILPEEWMKKFENYFKSGEIKKNGIQMSNYQFGIIDELYEEIDIKPAFLEELYNKKTRIQNISEIETVPIPKGIKAKLREYQHHGLNWLVFLDKNQLGGCLADDMGLGKTLQTIAFLQHLKITNPKNQPSLIIAPTSLIFNWRNEIEKFCPTLKMLTFTGGTRLENKDTFNNYDLIISTYGSLLNDIEFLKDFKFHYVILDESQAIKNPNSKRYKAVRLLHSYNKIALTGTPIENNTFDLYAQLNFLNPGILGNMTHFKTNFSDAIDKEKDVDASQTLSKIITPFMLRRTKEQVATELPEKTESIIFCEMEKEQRAVYNTFKNKYRDYLLNKIDENGVEKSQMYILEGLTKLRQICNSTALIPSDEDFGNYSVKLETLMENIKEKTGNHKILVFSQFVKMLQIVKTRLEEDHIHFEYLDGKTTNRQEKVENFQNNSDVRVFLISLKAGGTGLNLTEADYVFILDPWWNPAVENQAIDRCYRIGQTKKVMAYRMICKDTIEEKIVALQQKKKNVASSIISIDDEKKSFNIDEVKELFR